MVESFAAEQLQVRDTVAHRSNIGNIVPAAHAFTPEFRYITKK